MNPLVLLGPQTQLPNFHSVIKTLGLQGPLAVITAGWQEREGEVDELKGYARCAVTDLQLYRRTETLFSEEPALKARHRMRQQQLHEQQRLYRLQLGYRLSAARALQAETGSSGSLRAARQSALTAVRSLDRSHLRQIRNLHAAFERDCNPAQHQGLQRYRCDIAAQIDACNAVLIAGGHIAVLLNRLRLFDLGPLLARKPLLAWSAGAMALCSTVVLFHDRPPQGAGDAEILDFGLGLYRGYLPLPAARQRLLLDNPERVALFATRFAPAHCVTLDEGAILPLARGQGPSPYRVRRLQTDGRLSDYSL